MEKSARDYHLEHSRDRTARTGRDCSGAGCDSSVPSEPEVLVDVSRRIRPVQRVKMDAADLVVEQVAALFRGPMGSDL
jgi:hypothetical protein